MATDEDRRQASKDIQASTEGLRLLVWAGMARTEKHARAFKDQAEAVLAYLGKKTRAAVKRAAKTIVESYGPEVEVDAGELAGETTCTLAILPEDLETD